MRTIRTASTALLAVVLLVLPLRAEEESPPDAPEPGSAVTDAEARDLVRALQKVAKKRKSQPVLEVLAAIGERSHEDFHKPLLKLLTHDNTAVAIRAADILAVQDVEKERDREKLVKEIWKRGWSHRDNERRYGVRGRSLLAVAGIEKRPLDADRFEEVDRFWRWAVENPSRDWGVGLADVCTYVERTGDKRFCRWLAEEIDNPQPEDVNDPANPPREWWKRRWELWTEIKKPAVAALRALTGETFKTTKDAKAWFEENEKDFGFRW